MLLCTLVNILMPCILLRLTVLLSKIVFISILLGIILLLWIFVLVLKRSAAIDHVVVNDCVRGEVHLGVDVRLLLLRLELLGVLERILGFGLVEERLLLLLLLLLLMLLSLGCLRVKSKAKLLVLGLSRLLGICRDEDITLDILARCLLFLENLHDLVFDLRE